MNQAAGAVPVRRACLARRASRAAAPASRRFSASSRVARGQPTFIRGEAPPAGAEDRAVVEPQPGLAQDEVVELVRPQPCGREQTGAVQPQQVGALAGRGRDAGHRLQALDDVLTGRRDVLAQLVEPGVAVLVGSAAGDQPQGVGLGVAASVELGAEAGRAARGRG